MDRRSERHQATKDSILQEAWRLARNEGIGGFSMRQLAARVGMQAPSLYQYFDSKNSLYDAMYAQGFTALLERLGSLDDSAHASRNGIKALGKAFFEFCTEEPVRYQLMFERPIPDFEPTTESFALSEQALEQQVRGLLKHAGVTKTGEVDLFLAINAGLISQQIANDPGGNRWQRLLEDAMDMFFDYVEGDR